jgi:hypothetical protein
MNPLYPLTILIRGLRRIGAMLLLLVVWRYLLRRDRRATVQTVQEPDDYGTPVAPTG